MSPLHVAAASGDAELLERVLAALQRAGRERQPKAARRSFAKTVRPLYALFRMRCAVHQ